MHALWLCCALLAVAGPRPPEQVIAQAFDEGSWRIVGLVGRYVGDEVYEYMDGAGEIPLACGLQSLAVGHLQSETQGKLTVELFACADAADAFGIWSLRRQPGEDVVPFTHSARWIERELAGWRGTYAWVFSAPPDTTLGLRDVAAVAQALEGAIDETGAPPALLAELPTGDRLRDSERYFHGKFALDTLWFQSENPLGLATAPGPGLGAVEVVSAQYEYPLRRVLVARYRTAAAAQAALGRLQQLKDPLVRAELTGALLRVTITEPKPQAPTSDADAP